MEEGGGFGARLSVRPIFCGCDFSATPRGNDFKSGTNIHLGLMMKAGPGFVERKVKGQGQGLSVSGYDGTGAAS